MTGDVDAVAALADRMAEDLCLGFRWHDQRERERAVEAFARVDALQFAHVGADTARAAARAYVDALWAKDDLEASCVPDGEDEPDYDQLAEADWSPVQEAFAERAALVDINRAYAFASTEAWKRHKIGGDYWTPMLRAQHAELRAAMQDSGYPDKPHEGLSGFGPEAVRYLLGVELHDMHTGGHWKQAKRGMVPYFERILRSHDHHQPPADERAAEQGPELVTDGGEELSLETVAGDENGGER
mgnify:CR=1 FL=1